MGQVRFGIIEHYGIEYCPARFFYDKTRVTAIIVPEQEQLIRVIQSCGEHDQAVVIKRLGRVYGPCNAKRAQKKQTIIKTSAFSVLPLLDKMSRSQTGMENDPPPHGFFLFRLCGEIFLF